MFRSLRKLEPRQQVALALGSFLLVAELIGQAITGEVNVALTGAGVTIFGMAFTFPHGRRPTDEDENGGPQ